MSKQGRVETRTSSSSSTVADSNPSSRCCTSVSSTKRCDSVATVSWRNKPVDPSVGAAIRIAHQMRTTTKNSGLLTTDVVDSQCRSPDRPKGVCAGLLTGSNGEIAQQGGLERFCTLLHALGKECSCVSQSCTSRVSPAESNGPTTRLDKPNTVVIASSLSVSLVGATLLSHASDPQTRAARPSNAECRLPYDDNVV